MVTAGTSIPVTSDLTGGKIGGLLQYRNDLLQPAINRLGLVSLGLISSINAQHTQGMDLNSALGNNFFSELNSPTLEQDRVFANSSNSGNGNITMTIDDIGAVSSSEYRLTYNSGTFTITDSSNGQLLDTFVAPAVPGTYQNTSLGFTLNFTSGALVDGDAYSLSPTRNAVENLERTLTDITQIAVAIPVSATANLGNSGSAEIIGASVSNTSNASFTTTAGALAPPIRFEFTSATTYDVISNDGSNTVLASGVTFNANQTNNMLAQAGLDLGYEVQVGGGANSGDIFEVEYNTSGRGDNRNALAMANIQTENILNQGTSTLQETYGLLVSEVGTRTNEYTISLNATESLLRQNQARLEQVSGVNLDEEAAKLIKYQQSYQAAARIITTSNVIFDTLIASLN
jgi:flagellar hook-associated protein 1 FlgK